MGNLSLRLVQQFKFLIEIDKLKMIERQNKISDSSRRENSAEHSWHLAMLAVVLAEHSSAPVDILKVIKMLLVHDLVEIDAGDTFIHDPHAQELQNQKEATAAERIFALLPEGQRQELHGYWKEFEKGETAEASFAKALDRVQPALLHEATDAIVWQEFGTTLAQINSRMKEVRENTPALWPKVRSVIDKAVANGRLGF